LGLPNRSSFTNAAGCLHDAAAAAAELINRLASVAFRVHQKTLADLGFEACAWVTQLGMHILGVPELVHNN
jgi:hypothetical protein